MKHTITLIPGDGIGPEVTGAVVTILERAGLEVEWEPHLAGVLALEQHGATLPAELLDSIRRNKVALKGPVTTPVGGGFTSVNVGLRQGARAVREPAAGLEHPVGAVALRGRRPGDRAREHRGPVRRARARSRPGVVESLKIITAASSTRIAQVRLRVRAHARPQARDRRAQGEHHEDGRRAVPRHRVRKVAARLPRHRLRRSHRRRRLHAPGDEPDAVRRAAAAEPVRRHRLGPLRRARRRPRRRAGREPRRRDRRLRSRARQRARHRRQEHREPDGAAAVGGADAAAHRRRRDRRPDHEGARRGAERGNGPHARPRRHREHDRITPRPSAVRLAA